MSEGLKPCPFCGGPAIVFQHGKGWHAACKTRETCYALLNGFASREEAASEWNRRVTELKPLRACPFCGGKAKVYQAGFNVWKVMCDKLNCGTLVNDWNTPEEAIAAWNKRTISEEELQTALKAFQRKRCVDSRD